MFEKSKLLLRTFDATPHERHDILLETLRNEADLNPGGYEVVVRFHVTPDELIRHKAENPTHIDMTPGEHVQEMIRDWLYDDSGPLDEGDFSVVSVKEMDK